MLLITHAYHIYDVVPRSQLRKVSSISVNSIRQQSFLVHKGVVLTHLGQNCSHSKVTHTHNEVFFFVESNKFCQMFPPQDITYLQNGPFSLQNSELKVNEGRNLIDWLHSNVIDSILFRLPCGRVTMLTDDG